MLYLVTRLNINPELDMGRVHPRVGSGQLKVTHVQLCIKLVDYADRASKPARYD